MKIKNCTIYDTRVLRRIVCAVHRFIAKRDGKLRTWRGLIVEVVPSRGHCSGYAYYYGHYTRLRLPPAGTAAGNIVSLVYHEFMHLYGFRHGQFGEADDATILAICNDAGVHVSERVRDLLDKPKPPKPKPDLQVARYERLCEREKVWRAKSKRATTALKKITQQKRYYERTLRAAGKIT